MKNYRILQLIILIAILVPFLSGCSDNTGEQGDAHMKVYLTDNPGMYKEVNIDIRSVEVIINDSTLVLPTNSGIYNLLDFANGKDTILADAQFPAGKLSQIRLILGEDNTVLVDSETEGIDSTFFDLEAPSSATSGLKLNVHADLVPGASYSYVIDFDAEKSIVLTGSGKYLLKPVIRVFTEEITGAVHGIVSPAEADSLILLLMPDDTLSTDADTSGDFMFRGLQPGSYDLEIIPVESYRDTSLTGINILSGKIVELDTITLKPE